MLIIFSTFFYSTSLTSLHLLCAHADSCTAESHVRMHAVRRPLLSTVFFFYFYYYFHRDFAPPPLRLLSAAPQSVLQLCARARALAHAAAPSLSKGPCCGGVGGKRCAAVCHPTNEFLLTSRSPLKKQFVLKRRCAELPCSCLCSHTRHPHRRHLLSALFCYLCRRSLSPFFSHCFPHPFPSHFN